MVRFHSIGTCPISSVANLKGVLPALWGMKTAENQETRNAELETRNFFHRRQQNLCVYETLL